MPLYPYLLTSAMPHGVQIPGSARGLDVHITETNVRKVPRSTQYQDLRMEEPARGRSRLVFGTCYRLAGHIYGDLSCDPPARMRARSR